MKLKGNRIEMFDCVKFNVKYTRYGIENFFKPRNQEAQKRDQV